MYSPSMTQMIKDWKYYKTDDWTECGPYGSSLLCNWIMELLTVSTTFLLCFFILDIRSILSILKLKFTKVYPP